MPLQAPTRAAVAYGFPLSLTEMAAITIMKPGLMAVPACTITAGFSANTRNAPKASTTLQGGAPSSDNTSAQAARPTAAVVNSRSRRIPMPFRNRVEGEAAGARRSRISAAGETGAGGEQETSDAGKRGDDTDAGLLQWDHLP